ncbi:hypothetical protein ACO0LF_30235 [Undibacterium sp. Di27W]|uniref:hypothetical protein n=1 Tax=Undibacterium sp. Di27W TaxID=3413036 RepID=UPI003BEF73BC
MTVTSLVLNQDPQVKGLRVSNESSVSLDLSKQKAWMKAMEQSQMQEWLRQGLTHRDYFQASQNKPVQNSQDDLLPGFQAPVSHEETQIKDINSSGSAEKQVPPSNGIDDAVSGGLHIEAEVVLQSELQLAKPQPTLSASKLHAFSEQNLSLASQKIAESQASQHGQVSLAGNTQLVQAVTPNFVPKTQENTSVAMSSVTDKVQLSESLKSGLEAWTGVVAISSSLNLLSLTGKLDQQTNQATTKLATGFLASMLPADVIEKAEASEGVAETKVVPDPESSQYDHEAIRFHAEWSEEGLRLWLGIDSNTKIDIAQLSQQLRNWVAQQNVQLLSLVWNGQQISKSQVAQILKDGNKQNAPFADTSATMHETKSSDKHYFLNSYLHAKEMR